MAADDSSGLGTALAATADGGWVLVAAVLPLEVEVGVDETPGTGCTGGDPVGSGSRVGGGTPMTTEKEPDA